MYNVELNASYYPLVLPFPSMHHVVILPRSPSISLQVSCSHIAAWPYISLHASCNTQCIVLPPNPSISIYASCSYIAPQPFYFSSGIMQSYCRLALHFPSCIMQHSMHRATPWTLYIPSCINCCAQDRLLGGTQSAVLLEGLSWARGF